VPVGTALSVVNVPVQALQRIFVPDPVQVFGKDHLLVLIVGLDYDYDRLDQETSQSSRSDVIMALNLDFKNHRVYELSVPRDMVATLPSGQKAKINQAQSEGGIQESKSVIAGWLGIPSFDRYVVMRIDTSKDLINAIGGVDVNVENSDALRQAGPNGPIDYDDSWGHLHVHLKPGMQHLDGEHAVGYGRFRHDWCSDPCRIMRQQQVVHAVVEKIERNKFNTFMHAQQLLSVVRDDIQTDFTSREEIASVMAFSKLIPANVHTAQVPYTGDVVLPDYGDSIVPDEGAKQKLVASMLMQPPDHPLNNVAAGRARQADIRLAVENGTSVRGLATRVAANLRQQGFEIADVRDAASESFEVTQIRSSAAADSSASLRVRKALGQGAASAHISAVDVATQPPGADVTIILGRDLAAASP
ncbi:MAG TPA: LCP family protein, partial [Candidatus Baltobacteraceae bacterium]